MKTRKKADRLFPNAHNGHQAACALQRDLDGFVHTPAGYISRENYLRLAADNPDAGLPHYEDIPVMES